MKAADKITTLRIFLAPLFFFVFFFDRFFVPNWNEFSGFCRYWQVPALWIIFIVAELTDMFDGMAARKRGEVSDLGKLYDPFADTLLQITLFVCFVWHGILPLIPFLLVLYREFGILFIRNLMQKKGISLGARMGGKIKTVAYITAASFAMAVFSLQITVPLFWDAGLADLHERLYAAFSMLAITVFWLAVLLSILSFIDYIRVYRKS